MHIFNINTLQQHLVGIGRDHHPPNEAADVVSRQNPLPWPPPSLFCPCDGRWRARSRSRWPHRCRKIGHRVRSPVHRHGAVRVEQRPEGREEVIESGQIGLGIVDPVDEVHKVGEKSVNCIPRQRPHQ